jgi:predicted anti-sigma-YlaC factor YlaD
MKCTKAKKKISVYLDGELKEDEKQELLNHLEICDACRKEKEMLSSLLTTIEVPKEIEAPPYLFLKVKQKIEHLKHISPLPQAAPPLRWLRPITVGLGLIVMFFLSSLTGNYLGKIILSAKTQKESTINQEFNTTLRLVVFDDIPEESFGNIYNNLLTGKR